MATYKVIQDIEAEDKFVGPLSLKQFVFAMFGGLFAYLSFFVVTKGLTWGLIMTTPPMFFGFFMAIPWSSEQPTDVWVLAKIRFRIKPKKRVWDQVGVQDLVTITAPKKEERPRGNGLSQTEVSSRLKALADTLDSRGWVIKNSPLPALEDEASDRLVGFSITSPETAEINPPALPDMLEQDRDLDGLIKQSNDEHMFRIYDKLDSIRSSQSQPISDAQTDEIVTPPAENTPDEATLSQILKSKKAAANARHGNMHVIPASQPAAQNNEETDQKTVNEAPATEVEKAQAPMTEPPAADILEVSPSNDEGGAIIADKASDNDDEPDESKEVVISLH